MTVLEFIASLVSSLAWPAAVMSGVLVFRKQLLDLLPAVRSLRFKGLELDFQRTVRELTAETKAQNLTSPLPAAADALLDRLAEIAFVSPRAAILEAWLQVEIAAIELAQRRKVAAPDELRGNPARVVEHLIRAGVLSTEFRYLANKLRRARNQAVHAPEATFAPHVVRDYVALALTVAQHLRSLME